MDPQNLFLLTNRIIVITGGLGQLGITYCHSLVSLGAKVVLLDKCSESHVSNERLSDLLATESVFFVQGDVTSKSSISAALEKVISKWGTPDGLINNAALDSPPNAPIGENGPFEDYPEDSWDKVMEVNSKGVFLCCQVIGGAMAKIGRGSIINISSIYGLVSPNQNIYEYRRARGETFYKPAAYSASKSSLLNLTRYLATYWAKNGVRVNTLTLAGVFNSQDREFLEAYSAQMPIGRMASADEYNGPIIFLLSNASSYMTGANLIVDGGWTAW